MINISNTVSLIALVAVKRNPAIEAHQILTALLLLQRIARRSAFKLSNQPVNGVSSSWLRSIRFLHTVRHQSTVNNDNYVVIGRGLVYRIQRILNTLSVLTELVTLVELVAPKYYLLASTCII